MSCGCLCQSAAGSESIRGDSVAVNKACGRKCWRGVTPGPGQRTQQVFNKTCSHK